MQIIFKYTRNFFNIPFVYLLMADFKSKRKCSTDENHRRLIQQEGERYKINRLRCQQDVLIQWESSEAVVLLVEVLIMEIH